MSFRSEYTSSASVPGSRVPLPDMLPTAEGHVGFTAVGAAVDHRHAGPESACKFDGPMNIARVDAACQSVGRSHWPDSMAASKSAARYKQVMGPKTSVVEISASVVHLFQDGRRHVKPSA